MMPYECCQEKARTYGSEMHDGLFFEIFILSKRNSNAKHMLKKKNFPGLWYALLGAEGQGRV